MASYTVTEMSECSAATDAKRVLWTTETTKALINIWQNNLESLRSTSRNAKIYVKMLEELNNGLPANEGPYTVKQLRQKLNNLSKRFKKEHRDGKRTGGEPTDWPFYELLRKFLASLPMNDDDLVEENVEVPVVDEAPEEAEVVASWDDAYAENAGGPWPTEPVQAGPSNGDNSNGLVGLVGPTAGPSRPSASEPAASTAGPSQPQASPARGTSSNGRARMRPNASVLHQLLALHKEDSLRAAKAEKRRHRLQVQMLRLQRQATTAQIGMMEMMKEFFASRPNKNL